MTDEMDLESLHLCFLILYNFISTIESGKSLGPAQQKTSTVEFILRQMTTLLDLGIFEKEDSFSQSRRRVDVGMPSTFLPPARRYSPTSSPKRLSVSPASAERLDETQSLLRLERITRPLKDSKCCCNCQSSVCPCALLHPTSVHWHCSLAPTHGSAPHP